ncbi:MAG: hypothetical protein ACYC27_17275 [Armatimonadota bacterium]
MHNMSSIADAYAVDLYKLILSDSTDTLRKPTPKATVYGDSII